MTRIDGLADVATGLRRAVTLGLGLLIRLSFPGLVADLAAQGKHGLHVCVDSDRLLRYTPAKECPIGQTGYRLAEVEADAKAPEEEKASEKAMADLKSKVSFLTERVSVLEREKGRESTGNRPASRVFAPFEVLDKAGNSIFRVSANSESEEPKTAARVLISRGGGNNYSLRIRTPAGTDVASIGQTRSGAGTAYFHDEAGTERIIISGQFSGMSLRDAGGQEAAYLTIGKDGGGQMFLSKAGQTLVEAGSTSEGRGVVRTGPYVTCTGTRLPNGLGAPDCIMGRMTR